MVKAQKGTPELYLDNNTEGLFYEGLPDSIIKNNNKQFNGNLMLRMIMGNDPPQYNPALTQKNATIGRLFKYNVSATDDNRDSLTFFIKQAPGWLSIENKHDGNRAVISGIPEEGDIGSNFVKVGVKDDRDTILSSFTILVKESLSPEFLTSPKIFGYEGLAYTYKAIGFDKNGDDVTVSAELLPSWLSAVVSANGDTLTLSGIPEASDLGENNVKINVIDVYGKKSQQAFEVHVLANESPEFISFAPLYAYEGIEYNYMARTKDDNYKDVLKLVLEGPDWLSLSDNGDGTANLSGIPSNTDTGENEVILTVTDNNGASVDQTFTIMVQAANNPPVFTTTQQDTNVQAGELFTYEINVEDSDNDPISFATDMPGWMLFINKGDGNAVMKGQPLLEDLGTDSIIIYASDGLATVKQQFQLTVVDLKASPELKSTEIPNAIVNESFEFTISATDADGDALSFEAENIPSWLQFNDNSNGSALISGVPSPNNIGENPLILNISDGLHTVKSEINIKVENKSLGINHPFSKSIMIYPNPAEDVLNVITSSNVSVELYNMLGIRVLHKANIYKSGEMDVSVLDKGVYLLRCVDEAGKTRYAKKLIIQ